MSLIPLLSDCNQRCLFCSAHGRPDAGGAAFARKAIAAQAAAGASGIILSGGETTFSAHLPALVAFARKKGLRVEVQTNALTSFYPDRARKLAALGADLFNVNFPSHLPAVNDRITGTTGTLPLREAGVLNLLRAGAAVRLTHIVTSLNCRHLPAFAAYVGRRFPGVKYIQFSYLKGMGLALENAWLLPPYAEAGPSLARALAACRHLGIEAVVDHIPPCFLGRYYARHIDLIKTENGWDTALSRLEKKRLPACRGCVLKRRCFGPRKEHLELIGAGEFVRPLKELPK